VRDGGRLSKTVAFAVNEVERLFPGRRRRWYSIRSFVRVYVRLFGCMSAVKDSRCKSRRLVATLILLYASRMASKFFEPRARARNCRHPSAPHMGSAAPPSNARLRLYERNRSHSSSTQTEKADGGIVHDLRWLNPVVPLSPLYLTPERAVTAAERDDTPLRSECGGSNGNDYCCIVIVAARCWVNVIFAASSAAAWRADVLEVKISGMPVESTMIGFLWSSSIPSTACYI